MATEQLLLHIFLHVVNRIGIMLTLKWCWLGTLEFAPPQGLRFYSLWCQFRWVSLASKKKKNWYQAGTYQDP